MRALPLLPLLLLAVACGDNLTLPPEREPATSDDPAKLACTPDGDGTIARSELAAAIGVPIGYLVSPPGAERPVDLRGVPGDDGATVWDLSIDYADDRALRVTPSTPAGTWFEASFPEEGAFVTPLDPEGRNLSVGVLREDGLYLLGVASAEADPPGGRTLLVYQEPILTLALPVVVGNQHVAVGTIENGVIQGLPYAGRDVYEVEVDGLGALDLPQLSFDQVHRVTTKVTVEPVVGESVVQRQVSFYAECFAEVARATATADEDDALFATAGELRRLGL